MANFPISSRREYRNLAERLVRFLRERIGNTNKRKGWTKRNIRLLQLFADREGFASFPDKRGAKNEKQFLWDYVAYAKYRGLVIVAESEHDNRTKKKAEFKHDFEKLLYVRSPVKLMMCWAKSKKKADEILSWVKECMEPQRKKTTCTEFSPAEVFVLFCTCSAKLDFVYWLQIGGKPMHRAIKDEEFTVLPRE
ncbi:MAG: hypothetical protein ABSD72_02470 [Terracidiphilus sp.]|jgi:hypothetical protein